MRKNILNHSIFQFAFVIFLVLGSFSFRSVNKISDLFQNHFSDSTSFIANSAEGWIEHSSYLEDLGDSVRFELILFRNPAVWNNESEAGTISSGYSPSAVRVITYLEMPRTWKIKILPSGGCSFKLIDGPAPQGNPVVLPVLTKFKK